MGRSYRRSWGAICATHAATKQPTRSQIARERTDHSTNQINTAGETISCRPSALAWRALISRLPLRTSLTFD